jgi:lipopolysaccharide transport system ATP-binding protein
MGDRHWQIGVCGTFDVANYGDLLFPVIAESELTERLGPLTLHRFSYAAKTPPDWPYEVTSVADLPARVRALDGLLIGGGFLIRFDKDVAPGYLPPVPRIHHPTGYWLTPALVALQHDVPVVWNSPGMHCNEIPRWAEPLMEHALTLSRYVAVRDQPSAEALAGLTGAPVSVVPDTAFGLRRLLDLDHPPSAEYCRLRDASGLHGPYIVVQATLGVEGFVRFVERHAERLRGFRFLALPVGPVLGEHSGIVSSDACHIARLPEWPAPLVLAELIARSEAVVGHSYHLCITALVAGVPVFATRDLDTGKYTALRPFETIFRLPADGLPDIDWFVSRVGRAVPSARVRATEAPLRQHWDRVATALRADAPASSIPLNRLWQSLPTWLENAEQAQLALQVERARLDEMRRQLAAARQDSADGRARLDEATEQLAAARAATQARDGRIADMTASTSWRLTAPVRFVGRRLRTRERP